MGTRRLPVELIDLCLRFLREERREEEADQGSNAIQDLKSSSLVSRQWRPLAQAHIFRSIYYLFTAIPRDIDNNEMMNFPVFSLPMNLGLFFAFVYRHPAIASYIHTLSLRSDSLLCDRQRYPESEDGRAPEHNVYHGLLHEILTRLPQLRTLSLYNVLVYGAIIPEKRPSLQDLLLWFNGIYEAMYTVGDLRDLFATFSRIDTVSMINLQPHGFHLSAPEEDMSPAPHRVEIRHLKLVDLEVHTPALLARALSLGVHVDKVRCLSLENFTVWGKHDPQAIIDVLSPGLYELRFSVVQLEVITKHPGMRQTALFLMPTVFDALPVVNCHTCSELRTLSILFNINPRADDEVWRTHTQNLCDFVEQSRISAASHPHLRELAICLSMQKTANIPASVREYVEPLDALLVALVRRSVLETVTFEWAVGNEGQEMLVGAEFEEFVHESFPTLRDNDMVSVRACDRK
ncbi:hypothetical protein PsYK624_010840 [Phanerochaete sordida]|uniref:F-box domain-containing protein n=1 Tax=Phanerochaete sordida TaxID=48140 RepID=A0A9P3FYT3_9APHY|nr:hypothetical protein PsYK624_010840 [Phanerochaete sordida]